METNLITYKRILIGVDDSEFSRKAICHAHSIALQHDAVVALIHVTEPISPTNYGTDPLLGQQPLIVPETTSIQEETGRKLLEEMSAELPDISEIFTFCRTGHPRHEILAVAEEWKADLIVMGTHGRTGFDHFLSGSVSEGVMRRATCPVLVVPSKT